MENDCAKIQKPTAQWIAEQQAHAGVSDLELATAIGHGSARVQLLKIGQMRVPLNKEPQLADALAIKPGALMRRLLGDVEPALLKIVEHCLGARGLSEEEQKLIQAVREAGPGTEPVTFTLVRNTVVTVAR